MNCVELFVLRARDYSNLRESPMAIQLPHNDPVSFAELLEMGSRAQSLIRRHGVGPGDTVLLIDNLGPRLYASVLAILAMGATVVLVEPWMPIEKINRVINLVKPKLFLTNWLGELWGLRLKSVREIPHWVHVRKIAGEPAGLLHVENVAEDLPGILTFTSGTTGEPKGVVRNQGYLVHQHRILSEALELEKHRGPDLCIFANFALANLASGRGSVIVPPAWKKRDLKWLMDLSGPRRPESLTTGPAFLLELMKHAPLNSLESIHVGGALTDCWIFEEAFKKFPEAHILHIYGSSEAEPVAIADAKEAVRLSRERGYFQTLYLGRPIQAIEANVEPDTLWVAGPHVCPQYVGAGEENRIHKRREPNGKVWHSMGDRIRVDDAGWWYSGRSGQSLKDFELEQKVYSLLQTSKAFLVDENGTTSLCVSQPGDNRKTAFMSGLGELEKLHVADRIFEVEIKRDRRHRARIDRASSLKTRRPWRIG